MHSTDFEPLGPWHALHCAYVVVDCDPGSIAFEIVAALQVFV